MGTLCKGFRSPRVIYRPKPSPSLTLLLRNYTQSVANKSKKVSTARCSYIYMKLTSYPFALCFFSHFFVFLHVPSPFFFYLYTHFVADVFLFFNFFPVHIYSIDPCELYPISAIFKVKQLSF